MIANHSARRSSHRRTAEYWPCDNSRRRVKGELLRTGDHALRCNVVVRYDVSLYRVDATWCKQIQTNIKSFFILSNVLGFEASYGVSFKGLPNQRVAQPSGISMKLYIDKLSHQETRPSLHPIKNVSKSDNHALPQERASVRSAQVKVWFGCVSVSHSLSLAASRHYLVGSEVVCSEDSINDLCAFRANKLPISSPQLKVGFGTARL